jgi:hypothetical protein
MRHVTAVIYGAIVGLAIYAAGRMLEWAWRNTDRIEINRDVSYDC